MSEMKGKIEKLPKWAQEHIKDIVREREIALRALNEYIDNQTKSEFYFDDSLCTGELQGPTSKRVYVQTYQMVIENAGVKLRVMPRDNAIELGYESINSGYNDVILQPSSHQQMRLFLAEKSLR